MGSELRSEDIKDESLQSEDILDGEVKRSDLNVLDPGQAVIRKVLAGAGLAISSTGADNGTGDVELSVIPPNINNEYTIIPIWAEENGGLANGAFEWSWGNGSVGNDIGIVIPFECEIFAASFNADIFGTSVSVNLRLNNANVVTPVFTSQNGFELFTPIPVAPGDLLSFQTNTVVGTTTDARICAWMRVKATAAFPTPERSVVSNSNVGFASTAFAQIPGMSTTVSVTDVGTLDAILTYSVVRSGTVNAITQMRVVINGDNGESFTDTVSTFNDVGAISHFVTDIPAGTYTITAEAATTQPVNFAAVVLTASGVEK